MDYKKEVNDFIHFYSMFSKLLFLIRHLGTNRTDKKSSEKKNSLVKCEVSHRKSENKTKRDFFFFFCFLHNFLSISSPKTPVCRMCRVCFPWTGYETRQNKKRKKSTSLLDCLAMQKDGVIIQKTSPPYFFSLFIPKFQEH